MITFMQKVRDYFAKREGMRKYRKGKVYFKTEKNEWIELKPVSEKQMKKMLPPAVVLKLADGSTVELTSPKQKGTLEVSL